MGDQATVPQLDTSQVEFEEPQKPPAQVAAPNIPTLDPSEVELEGAPAAPQIPPAIAAQVQTAKTNIAQYPENQAQPNPDYVARKNAFQAVQLEPGAPQNFEEDPEQERLIRAQQQVASAHSMVPQAAVPALDAFQRHVNEPLDKMSAAGAEAGRDLAGRALVTPPTELGATGDPNTDPPVTQAQVQERLKALPAPMVGVIQAMGGTVGGMVADPRMWPFFLAGPEAGAEAKALMSPAQRIVAGARAASPVLQKTATAGFAGQMAHGTYEAAGELGSIMDNPDVAPEAKWEAGANFVLSAIMAGQATVHAGKPMADPQVVAREFANLPPQDQEGIRNVLRQKAPDVAAEVDKAAGMNVGSRPDRFKPIVLDPSQVEIEGQSAGAKNVKPGKAAAMKLGEGQKYNGKLYKTAQLENGDTYVYNPKKTNEQEIHAAAANGTLWKLVGEKAPPEAAAQVQQDLKGEPQPESAAAKLPDELKPPIRPEPSSISAAPESPPGRRWNGDRGTIPGEPTYFLDGDVDNAKAAITPHETADQSGTLYDVHLANGELLGTYGDLKSASTAGEYAVDHINVNKPAEVPAPQMTPQEVEHENRRTTEGAELRSKFSSMTPDQQTQSLMEYHQRERTSAKTGLPNLTAFDEDEKTLGQTHPAVGYADLDDFKKFNDLFGHKGVDEAVLPHVGKVFEQAAAKEPSGSVKVYHRSGDEFNFRATTPEAIKRVADRVNAELAETTFKYQKKDGTIVEKKGIGLSHGIGADHESAEHSSHADKIIRKETGLRTGARDVPAVDTRSGAGSEAPEREGTGRNGVSGKEPSVDLAAAAAQAHKSGDKDAAKKALRDLVRQRLGKKEANAAPKIAPKFTRTKARVVMTEHGVHAEPIEEDLKLGSADSINAELSQMRAQEKTVKDSDRNEPRRNALISELKRRQEEKLQEFVRPNKGRPITVNDPGTEHIKPHSYDGVITGEVHGDRLAITHKMKDGSPSTIWMRQEHVELKPWPEGKKPAAPESGEFKLETPPADVGAKQYLESIPDHYQRYAKDYAAALKEGGIDQARELDRTDYDFSQRDDAHIDDIEAKLEKFAKEQPNPINKKIDTLPLYSSWQKEWDAKHPKAEEPKSDYGSKNTVFTEDKKEAALKRLRDKMGRLNAGFDPDAMNDLIDIGGYHFEAGLREFADWSKQMAKDVGDWAIPYLKTIHDEITEVLGGKIEPEATNDENREGTEKPAAGSAEKGPDGKQRKGAGALVQDVYDKLKAGESLGNVTEFNKMAEEHFGSSRVSGAWTPKDAFDAMEAGVNKFLMDHGKKLMGEDAIEGLRQIRGVMERIPSQGVRTEEQIKNQQFSTPPTEAYLVAKVAGIKPSDVVLEPSAGNGGIAIWAKAMGAETHVNEIAPRRQEMLKEVGFDKPTAHDGELINALLDPKVKPTVVVMNPPFSASTMKSHEAANNNQYGFNHLDQALQRLEPNGRLVAILGGGRADDTNGGATLNGGPSGKWFDKIANRYNVRANIRVNGKEYQKYGTSFATRIIVIDKDGPTESRTSGVKTWDGVKQANVNTLEEAYRELRDVAGSRPEQTRTTGETGAGERKPTTGVGADKNDGGTGDRNGLQGKRDDGASNGPSDRSDRPGGKPRSDQSGKGDKPVSLREPEVRHEADHEAKAAGSAESDHKDGDAERPVSGLEIENAGERHAEREDTTAYVAYQPSIKGPAHPGSIVETKTMATVPLPPITYKPALPDSIIKEGKLSAVQLEAVSIAGQQNDIVLPSGHRAMALIGDGTGVGKGREGAAIMLDHWNNGRKRIVYVSEKWDLMDAASRDLKAIGAHDLDKKMIPFGKIKATTPIDHEGVIFSTYALIRSEDKKGNTRLAQIKQWLNGKDDANGAAIIWDEAHNLKNAVTEKGQEASQIGVAAKKLMQELPNLRTTSLSATAATDVMNMGYMDRLGLWGPGTAFPGGFMDFANNIARGGMSAMEMIARELKARGQYVSRTLSYKGVTYSELEHKITPEQKELYRSATKAWQSVVEHAEDTIANTTGGGPRARGRFLSQFYSSQQRFFNVLLTTLKIPTAVEKAQQALADGKSVVITLVNTNEAAQNREKNKYRGEDHDSDEVPDYDFGPGEMLQQLIREHYPVQQYMDDVDGAGNPIKTPVVTKDDDGRELPLLNPEAVAARDALLKEIKQNLHMPANPLDILIDQLGGQEKVAELTGRKEKYDQAAGRFVPRGGKDVKRDEINLSEMRNFQNGKKRVAVLSSAAGTGISLHADNNAPNKQQRVHITLQPGWSADRAMQMLGRTHRTDQAHPPEYVLLKSDLGGEARFISTIARRLGSLEALSKGQSKTNEGTDMMSKVNFETDQGRQATNAFYTKLLANVPIPGTEGGGTEPLKGMQILDDLRVLKQTPGGAGKTVPDADRTNVTRLLNRLLALDPDKQNAVYNYFYDIFDATVKEAVENGTLDTGVKNLPGDTFNIKEERALASDPDTGAKTFYYPIETKVKTNRVSGEDMADTLRRKEAMNARVLRNKDGKLVMAIDAMPIVHASGNTEPAVQTISPENGNWKKVPFYSLNQYQEIGKYSEDSIGRLQREVKDATFQRDYAKRDLDRNPADYNKTRLVSREERLVEAEKSLDQAMEAHRDPKAWAQQQWQERYDKAPTHDTQEHHLIGGAVMHYWNPIHEASPVLNIYTTVDSKTGNRVVGVDIPKGKIEGLINRISGGKSTVNAKQIWNDVLRNNTPYQLEGGIQVKQGRVAGKRVVQFIPPNEDVAHNLRHLGVIYEKGVMPIHYLADNGLAENTLSRVLKEYPAKVAGADAEHDEEPPEPSGVPPEQPAVKLDEKERTTLNHVAAGRGTSGEDILDRAMESGLSEFDAREAIARLARKGLIERVNGPGEDSVFKKTPAGTAARNSGERGSSTPAAMPIPALIEAAAKGVKKVGELYHGAVDKLLEATHMGQPRADIRKYDPDAADLALRMDAGGQYHKAVGEMIAKKITGPLTEEFSKNDTPAERAQKNDMSRDRMKGFHFMADKQNREWLEENHPEEFKAWSNDPKIKEAVEAYKPFENDLRAAVKQLGGKTIDDDYIKRIMDFTTGGIAYESGVMRSIGIEGPELPREGGTKIGGPSGKDSTVSPQVDRSKARKDSGEFYWNHGVFDFGPSFQKRWTEVMSKLDEHRLAVHAMSNGTRIDGKDGMPEKMFYNGQEFYRPDIAKEIREINKRGVSSDSKALADQLGVSELPAPKDVRQYGVYEPMKGSRFENAARNLASRVLREGPDAPNLEANAATVNRMAKLRYAIPQEITEALHDAGREKEVGAMGKIVTKLLGPVIQAIRQQVVGLAYGVPHMANVLRKVMQATRGSVLNPMAWVNATKVAFSKELKERGISGVADPTYDMLLKNAAISEGAVPEYKHYIEGNLNPANWSEFKETVGNAFRTGGKAEAPVTVRSALAGAPRLLFEPLNRFSEKGHDNLFKTGGIDQRARLWLADYAKAQYPRMSESRIAHEVNSTLGRYNRASWTDMQRAIAPLMFFPGWDYSSITYALKHPFKTTMAPAVIMAMANAVISGLGGNHRKDEHDLGAVHAGDYSIKTNLVNDNMGSHIWGWALRGGQSMLDRRGTKETTNRAIKGIPGDLAGVSTGLLNPLLSGAVSASFGKQRPGGGGDIVPQGDFKRRGIIPGTSKAATDYMKFAGSKAFPLIDTATNSGGRPSIESAARLAGVNVYKNRKKK